MALVALLTASCATLFFGQTGCQVAPAATVDHGEMLFSNYCAPCHSADGSGKPNVAAPAIAGLPDWYVLEQLHKFRAGDRGTHFDDIEGMRMRPMSMTVRSETDLQALGLYIAALPPRPAAATLTGDAEKGKSYYTTCAACHGPEALGNEAVGSPPLTLQQDWYLVTQIGKFRKGIRGADPQDIRGAQMRPMANTLPDDAAIADVVAYIQTLRK